MSFWTDAPDRHKELARTFYEGIEYTYPDRVTSRRMCPCLDYCRWCGHPLEGKAEYVEYKGENI
jgi:hypothetical protein